MMQTRNTLILALLLASVLLVHTQARKASAAAPGSRNQDIAAAIQKLEEGMRLAALKGDAGWWDTYLADNFTDTDFQGKVSGKAEIVEMYRSSQLSFETLNLSDRTLRIFAGDTVIVTGKMTAEGTYRGQNLSGDFQFTRVWIKMNLEWKLAASQATRIVP
jgi:ketosteroid isomerase-like protein